VTDAQGCSDTASFEVEEPTTLVIDVAGTIITDADCNGALTGSITLAVSGGTPAYTYNWTGPNSFTASTANITNLASGTYEVTVTDAQGCSDTASFDVEEPIELELSATKTDETCATANGTIDVTVSGGTNPYTYAWNDGETTEDRTD
jgi:hypothetical protein